MSAYREIVLEGLRREGYDIEHMEDLDQETKQEIREGMKEIKEGNYSRLIHSIVTATPDETNISHLERKQELTQEERHQLKHWK
ncbi:hypothetical protein, partial [Tritonibacter sp. SIMBA_163]|uniref:hypothetical protein n=1 Tax=Tritonibacter sp. SIMBA_163 TaxID=3080868 RepID=UPI0039805AA6